MASPGPRSSSLRKGRYSQPGEYYFLTTSVAGRRKIFWNRGWKPLPRGKMPLPQGKNPLCGRAFQARCPGKMPLPQDQDHAIIVLNSIRWIHDSGRFIVDAAVVMPDHLHFVGRLGDSTLAAVMHSLKSYTANTLSNAGVESPIWQDGYHDHGLRDDEDYRVKVRYVLQNPLRARLASRVEDYPYVMLPKWWVS
jgi:putative transposase